MRFLSPRRWFQFRLSTWFVLVAILGSGTLSPNLASAGEDDVQPPQQWKLHVLIDGQFSSAVATPDARKVAALNREGTSLHVFDAESGAPLRRTSLDLHYAQSLAMSPDGRRVLVAASSASQVIDLESGDIIKRIDRGALQCRYSASGKLIVLRNRFSGAVVRLSDGVPVYKAGTDEHPVRAFALTADEREVLVASEGTCERFDLGTNNVLSKYELPPCQRVIGPPSLYFWPLEISPDGSRFAIGNNDGVHLYHLRRANLLGVTLFDSPNVPTAVVWSPDARLYAACSRNGNNPSELVSRSPPVVICDGTNGEVVCQCEGEGAIDVCFNATGESLFGLTPNSWEMWEAQNGRRSLEIRPTKDGFWSYGWRGAFLVPSPTCVIVSGHGLAIWKSSAPAD